MGKQPADKEKPAKAAKPAKEAKETKEAKPAHPGDAQAKPKKAKAAPDAAAAKEKEAPVEKPKPAPRPPADPRLKVLKKFYGKFLPRGPLRDRHKQLMARWNSGEDHGDVTLDELKSLLEDWRKARAKPVKAGTAG
jgi:hypothetical protein